MQHPARQRIRAEGNAQQNKKKRLKAMIDEACPTCLVQLFLTMSHASRPTANCGTHRIPWREQQYNNERCSNAIETVLSCCTLCEAQTENMLADVLLTSENMLAPGVQWCKCAAQPRSTPQLVCERQGGIAEEYSPASQILAVYSRHSRGVLPS